MSPSLRQSPPASMAECSQKAQISWEPMREAQGVRIARRYHEEARSSEPPGDVLAGLPDSPQRELSGNWGRGLANSQSDSHNEIV